MLYICRKSYLTINVATLTVMEKKEQFRVKLLFYYFSCL